MRRSDCKRACARVYSACVNARTWVSDCLFLGTTAGWWTWRSWCWRSDMMQRCGERAPRALTRRSCCGLDAQMRGRRADPLCLFLLYLSSPKKAESNGPIPLIGGQKICSSVHTCSCSQKYSGNERGRFEEGKLVVLVVVKQCQGDLTVYVGSLVLGWNLIEDGKTSLLVLLLWPFTGQHSALLGLWST